MCSEAERERDSVRDTPHVSAAKDSVLLTWNRLIITEVCGMKLNLVASGQGCSGSALRKREQTSGKLLAAASMNNNL